MYGGECWVIWWGVELHCRVLSYMVGSIGLHCEEHWLTWSSVGLHGGECWVTWWGVLGYMIGVLDYMVESVLLHGEC